MRPGTWRGHDGESWIKEEILTRSPIPVDRTPRGSALRHESRRALPVRGAVVSRDRHQGGACCHPHHHTLIQSSSRLTESHEDKAMEHASGLPSLARQLLRSQLHYTVLPYLGLPVAIFLLLAVYPPAAIFLFFLAFVYFLPA